MLILVAACVLAAGAWVYLLAGHGGFWRTDVRLPGQAGAPDPGRWPSVAAVVPARNEAAILLETLPTLLAQDYPGAFSVVLVDDASTDGTGAVAAALATAASGEPGPPGSGVSLDGAVSTRASAVSTRAGAVLRVIGGSPSPPGWAGKVWAMAQGAAAGGLERIAGARIDDVALARLLKRGPARARCWLGFTTRVHSRRPYTGLGGLWDMIARSAYTQLRYSPALLAGTVAGLCLLYLLPPVATLGGLAAAVGHPAGPAAWWGCAGAGLAGWALMTLSYLPVLRLYRLSPLRAPCLPVIALLYTAMTVDSARRHRMGRGGGWKGRA